MSIRCFRAAYLLGSLAFCLWGVTAASAQELYTTQNDFAAAFSNSGAAVTVGPPGVAGDSDLSPINGIGNNTNPGGVGTPGALFTQVNTLGFDQVNFGDESTNAAFLSAVKTNTLLTFDYTLPQTLTTGANGYFQITGVWNWTGGFQQFNNNAFFTATTLTAGTYTVTMDYSALQAGLPSGPGGGLTYFQLELVENCGGSLTPATPFTVYIDNIRLGAATPEPASLALLASGSLGLLGFAYRRRRR
ncbi:MAG: PEP-CTERM sorting domain-containing protein [Candidatus Sulfotelmatobacter sp.]